MTSTDSNRKYHLEQAEYLSRAEQDELDKLRAKARSAHTCRVFDESPGLLASQPRTVRDEPLLVPCVGVGWNEHTQGWDINALERPVQAGRRISGWGYLKQWRK